MTDDDRTGYSRTAEADRVAEVVELPRRGRRPRRGLLRRRGTRHRRRIRWLRLFAILLPLAFLALISFVFGVVLAFAPKVTPLTHDLYERFENQANSENTIVYSDAASGHKRIATLAAHDNQYFLSPRNVPSIMAHAIVAIEDKRFYTESGVDIKGIARAFLSDVFGSGGTQGASTITEQFVKIALGEEGHRTIFEKLKEAAMAFQLSHLWSKSKILAEYLNTAYFGSGAYGVEAAARTYFGNDPSSPLYGCGANPSNAKPLSLCVTRLTPDEAALLAALVNAPSEFNDLVDARAARERRNLVLTDMEDQHYLTAPDTKQAEAASLPTSAEVATPEEEATDASAGYFTSWVADQLQDDLGYHKIYGGGYKVYTTLDATLQQAAQETVDSALPAGAGGPSAALVAIQTDNGDVRAMVGGYDYNQSSFNLATQAERQPGSAFKAFDLAAALESGHFGPDTDVLSAPYTYPAGSEWSAGLPSWSVRNDDNVFSYAQIPLWQALAVSDNSVFSRVSLSPWVGPPKIAAVAHQFGITTTISLNPSMVIGGLQTGVTPLDMAHAYETIANGGRLTTGSRQLTSYACAGGTTDGYAWQGVEPTGNCPGPVGISTLVSPSGRTVTNHTRALAMPGYTYADDQTEIGMLQNVLGPIGTASSEAIPGVDAWGKTGTTNNYVDAWFVGSIPRVGATPALTVAVWVGYPTGFKEMNDNYGGEPVYGATFPAEIWHDFMVAAMSTFEARANGGHGAATSPQTQTTPPPSAPTSGVTASTSPVTPTGAGSATTGASGSPTGASTPAGTTAASGPSVTTGGGSTVPATTTTPGTSGTQPPTTTTPASAPTGATATGGTTTTTPASAPSSSAGTGTTGGAGATTTPAPPPTTGAGGGVTAPG